MMAERRASTARVIEANKRVESLRIDGGRVKGVVLASGEELTRRRRRVQRRSVPHARRSSARQNLPAEYNARIDGYERPGSTFKVNLALRGLPKFTCLPEDRGQFGPTIHLLPDEKDVMRHIKEGFAMVQRGELDPFPTIEWYIHTTVDPSLKDDAGNHNSALFVQWVPYTLEGLDVGSGGGQVRQAAALDLRSLRAGHERPRGRHVPAASAEDRAALRHPHGHIHHVDNGFGFADRLPYATPIEGLYSCSAGCHPGGQRHRRRRPQRRQPRAEGSTRMKLKIDFSLPKLVQAARRRCSSGSTSAPRSTCGCGCAAASRCAGRRRWGVARRRRRSCPSGGRSSSRRANCRARSVASRLPARTPRRAALACAHAADRASVPRRLRHPRRPRRPARFHRRAGRLRSSPPRHTRSVRSLVPSNESEQKRRPPRAALMSVVERKRVR